MFLPLYILFPYLPRLLLLCGASFLPSSLIFFWQERRFDYPTVTPASRGQLPRWSCLYLAGSSSRERPRGRMHRRGRKERLSFAGERVSMASLFVCLFFMNLCKNGAHRKCAGTLFAGGLLTFVYGVTLPPLGSKCAGDAARQCQGAGPALLLPLARSLD